MDIWDLGWFAGGYSKAGPTKFVKERIPLKDEIRHGEGARDVKQT